MGNNQATTARVSPFPVDWTNVRGVYKKLQTDFHLLLSPFKIVVPDERNIDLSHLICAIDVVDRELDRRETALARTRFIASVLAYLNGESQVLDWELDGEELRTRMVCLREIIERHNIQTEFCDTVQVIVDHGEAKRVATDDQTMIHHLVEEWRLTGRLPVLVLGDLSNREFERFFYLCCATMPAIDMLQDAKSDFQCGQIGIRPTLGLYWKLLVLFLRPLPRLAWLFPAPLTLCWYAISFIWEGITRSPALS